jgi:hypothetical protein
MSTTPNESPDELRVTTMDGKYTVILSRDGHLSALRYGQPWRDCVGDGLILALAQDVETLKGRLTDKGKAESRAELSGAELIAEERTRQISEDGWTPEHDDTHADESIASAAACYAAPRPIYTKHEAKRGTVFHDPFPWGRVVRNGRSVDDPDGWHTFTTEEKKAGKDRVRQLIIAGALIAAEIDRIQRLAARPVRAGVTAPGRGKGE